jgi:hypothetical protein
MEVFVVFDEDLLGDDFVDDIDVVTSKKSAKRLNSMCKLKGEDKRDYVVVDITTHDKMPELLKTLLDHSDDGDDTDNDSDGKSASSGSSVDESELPKVVYLVTPVEDEEKDEVDIIYADEIEVFVDKTDALVYIDARKRDKNFKDVKMCVVEKQVYRDKDVKKEYEKAKDAAKTTSVETKKKESKSSSAGSSSSSGSASSSEKKPKESKKVAKEATKIASFLDTPAPKQKEKKNK